MEKQTEMCIVWLKWRKELKNVFDFKEYHPFMKLRNLEALPFSVAKAKMKFRKPDLILAAVFQRFLDIYHALLTSEETGQATGGTTETSKSGKA